MSDTAATASVDCPHIPDDAQWNEMLQSELLCGKDGELAYEPFRGAWQPVL